MAFQVLGEILVGVLILLSILTFTATVYKYRKYHLLFGIPQAEIPETAPLMALIGWNSLAFGAMMLRSLIQRDHSSLLFDCTCLFHVVLFTCCATEIPKSLTIPPMLLSFTAIVFLSLTCFQYDNWTEADNAIYLVLIFVGAIGVLTSVVSLHWKTREQLIRKVSKAEKKIAKAQKWFLFGKKDVV